MIGFSFLISACNIKSRVNFDASANTSYIQERGVLRLKDTMRYDKIELRRLDDLDFSDVEGLSLSEDLSQMIDFSRTSQQYRDKEQFRKRLYKKYGLTREKVEKMSPLELIVRCSEIVADNIAYVKNVDPKAGSFFEDSFSLEKQNEGDCSMYANSIIYLFELLKEHNEKAGKVYVGKCMFGRSIRHDWNAVYVVSRDRLQIALIDTTFFDNGRGLDAYDEAHMDGLWRIKFFNQLGDYEEALKEAREMLTAKGEDRDLVFERAFAYFMAKDYKTALEDYEWLEKFNREVGYNVDYFLQQEERCRAELRDSATNH